MIKTFYLSNISQPTELQDVVNAVRTLLEVSRIQQVVTQQAIVMRGTPDQILLAEKVVNDIDKAPPEVVVNVDVMQVSRDKAKDLGIKPPTSDVTGHFCTKWILSHSTWYKRSVRSIECGARSEVSIDEA